MKKTIFTLAFALLAFSMISTGTATNHSELVVTPDHPLYDVKTSVESQVEELAPNETAKAQTKIEQADKRLSEMEKMADENKTEYVNSTGENYSEEMSELQELSENISDENQSREVNEIVANATMKHAEVLSRVYEKVPEQAKKGVGKALNQSVKGHRAAMNNLEQLGGKPDLGNITDRIPSDVRSQAGIPDKGQQRDTRDNQTTSGQSNRP